MSLVDNAMTASIIMDKRSVSDGRGGLITQYVDGVEINIAYSFDSSTQARIGEQQGATSRYILTTRKNVNLQYHDVFNPIN